MSRTVDARGSRCPHPVIALARAAVAAEPQTVIELLADDPVSLTDVPAWCRMRGARLQGTVDEGDHWRFVVVIER
ncbi:MAG: sulfurtransferase TusA family protein [Actinobacteria bacterium]|nr:sulfurtransferase TusA family protein [Actinomycetota bacterium]MCB8995726.1 sulfurtransferase TusA family protein [Actinomycetota bacterium]MCB9414687.1 sulfurtransferase TusA family protein [Actinomycetota bacterium]HRY10937.1 sulfurtransferase TusA family protein [Candidatus Nanopelagicales bacterium]